MSENLRPAEYGRRTFYVKVGPHKWIMIDRVKHLFSTVAAAHLFSFHISPCDIGKTQNTRWSGCSGICFDCDPDTGIRIMAQLKKTGKADLTFFFCN